MKFTGMIYRPPVEGNTVLLQVTANEVLNSSVKRHSL